MYRKLLIVFLVLCMVFKSRIEKPGVIIGDLLGAF
jgi:hypothetical protein